MKKQIKCETKGCDLKASALSYSDKPVHYRHGDDIMSVEYDRTTKWKCLNGHISTTKSKFSPLPPVSVPDQPSTKRFHRKGFTGHTPPKAGKNPFRGISTNHQRHQANNARRDMIAQMNRDARAKAAVSE